ncbi:11751_t:CDS:2, partial [Dentiscutata heterogama]
MVKSELFLFLIVFLLGISCIQVAPTKSYSSIRNPGVNISSSFILPDGIVFKFVLYTGGLANYIYDTASDQWIENNDILLRSAIPSDTSVVNVTVLGSSPSSNPENYHDEFLLIE